MDELRVVRREEGSLIVANEAGDEFRLLVDASVLADLRHLARESGSGSRVSPRAIQALVRAGKTRAEIIEALDIEESDIERYEEPVLAERRFILSSAHQIPVRTSPADQKEQQFGAVIAERLIGLVAEGIRWESWRDDEAGWMVSLEFDAQGVDHRAIWSFDHRKGLLSPVTQDAVSLSKQGDVGDRLIPKLRAVDDLEPRGKFESGAFEEPDDLVQTESPMNDGAESPEEVAAPPLFSTGAEAALKAGHPSTGSIPIIDDDSEFARRREIEERAIKTSDPVAQDLGQTADLLEALRRRRGEREGSETGGVSEADSRVPPQPVPLRVLDSEASAPDRVIQQPDEFLSGATLETVDDASQEQSGAAPDKAPKPEGSKRGKGRSPIPSWDDILFGTRSDGDD